jgi:hypothetical protein
VITPLDNFLFFLFFFFFGKIILLILISDFSHIFRFRLNFLFSDFFNWCYSRRSVVLFILIFYLGTMLVLIPRFDTVFVLIFHHGMVFVLFEFIDLFRSKFKANSMTLPSSSLQIRRHDYSEHLNFVISNAGYH